MHVCIYSNTVYVDLSIFEQVRSFMLCCETIKPFTIPRESLLGESSIIVKRFKLVLKHPANTSTGLNKFLRINFTSDSSAILPISTTHRALLSDILSLQPLDYAMHMKCVLAFAPNCDKHTRAHQANVD